MSKRKHSITSDEAIQQILQFVEASEDEELAEDNLNELHGDDDFLYNDVEDNNIIIEELPDERPRFQNDMKQNNEKY